MKCFARAHLASSLAALGVLPSRDIFAELADAYAAPDRHYHTARHVDACLEHFQHYRSLVKKADAERYFELRPRDHEKVVPMPAAAA